MELKTAQLFIIVLLSATASYGEVLIQPKSFNVLPNVQNLITTCKGARIQESQIGFDQPISKFVHNLDTQPDRDLLHYGIHLSVIKNDSIITWTFNITNIYNATKIVFKCYFIDHHAHISHPSDKATISVINETMLAPNITEYTETFIECVWYPLEHFNVSYYIVNVTNTTSGITELTTTEETIFNLSTNESSTSGHPLVITVEAFTDVGSVVSTQLITGFPKRLTPVRNDGINVDIFKKQNGSIFGLIVFAKPQVFSYQKLHYNITVEAISTSSSEIFYWETDTPSLNVNGKLAENKVYRLNIIVWEVYREDILLSTSYIFNTNFSSTPRTTPSPLPTPRTTPSPLPTPSPSFSPSVAYSTPTASSSNMIYYYIGAASGGTVALLVLTIIIVMIIVLLRLEKIKRNRQSSKVDEEKAKGTANNRKTSMSMKIPQMMATNPTYEATTPVYECLPHDLKSLSDSTLPTISSIATYMDIPPQIPPPRKMSLDSPGIKSGTEVMLLKVPMEMDMTDNGEYMYMKATQSRYVKSPGMKLKLKGEKETNIDSPSTENTEEKQ